MARAHALLAELKRALKEEGLTYRDVATHLGLSEASVKRLFSRSGFSLDRLEKTLQLLRMDFTDLVGRLSARREYVSQLTPAQEDALVSDPILLVITFLVLNRWAYDEILATFDFSASEIEGRLIRLDRLKIIELLPFNRYRLLTARNFTWRRDGPVQQFFATQIQSEFFDSRFDKPGEELRFVGGALTPESVTEMLEAIDRLAQRFDELVEQDSRLGMEERYGCSAVFAMRPVEFSMFAKHRVVSTPKQRKLSDRRR